VGTRAKVEARAALEQAEDLRQILQRLGEKIGRGAHEKRLEPLQRE
jgi:hypothetical protein